MESGPTIVSYIGYGIVCLFLLVVTIGVLRSAMLFSSLAILPFVRNRKKQEDTASSLTPPEVPR
jgi:hypothetical protein